MPERIAVKLSEEFFAMISELVEDPTDVFEDKTYAVINITNIENFEINIKFMNEDDVFTEVQNDSDMHILGL